MRYGKNSKDALQACAGFGIDFAGLGDDSAACGQSACASCRHQSRRSDFFRRAQSQKRLWAAVVRSKLEQQAAAPEASGANKPRIKRQISSIFSNNVHLFSTPENEKSLDESRGYRWASLADWDMGSGRNPFARHLPKLHGLRRLLCRRLANGRAKARWLIKN